MQKSSDNMQEVRNDFALISGPFKFMPGRECAAEKQE